MNNVISETPYSFDGRPPVSECYVTRALESCAEIDAEVWAGVITDEKLRLSLNRSFARLGDIFAGDTDDEDAFDTGTDTDTEEEEGGGGQSLAPLTTPPTKKEKKECTSAGIHAFWS